MNAVVFDMDGVMFDTERLAIKAWDWIGEQMGIGKVGYMVLKPWAARRKNRSKFSKRFR